MTDRVTIDFDDGTVTVRSPEGRGLRLPPSFVFDERVGAWRGEALAYAELILSLRAAGQDYDDQARAYAAVPLRRREGLAPRDYQAEAVASWRAASRRGVVVLPTGTGKSLVARLAMEDVCRSTLVVAPTIDLMEQWASQLASSFGVEVGLLGGGSHEVRDVTVSTYDSAVLQMPAIGNRFGLLVVDECHHLPGATYRQLARLCLAPFRLGLSATPERPDGGETGLEELLGPICFRRDIDEFEGRALSPYRTELVPVSLYEDEQSAYQSCRQRYVEFLRSCRVDLSRPDGWQQFLRACSQASNGREAFDAYLEQRRLSRSCRAKFEAIWRLLSHHRGERTLVFTADNPTAYEIGQRFCLPVLTHHTRMAERRELLSAFRSGELPALVTSRILNEGVDVPEASVGIVVSGTGSVREHVQRLGRILRPASGKQAVLYELVSVGTGEEGTSDRRRQHRAYGRPDGLAGLGRQEAPRGC